jgi:hypothetical protein
VDKHLTGHDVGGLARASSLSSLRDDPAPRRSVAASRDVAPMSVSVSVSMSAATATAVYSSASSSTAAAAAAAALLSPPRPSLARGALSPSAAVVQKSGPGPAARLPMPLVSSSSVQRLDALSRMPSSTIASILMRQVEDVSSPSTSLLSPAGAAAVAVSVSPSAAVKDDRADATLKKARSQPTMVVRREAQASPKPAGRPSRHPILRMTATATPPTTEQVA